MSSYATLADLTIYGLPAAALGSVGSQAIQAALDAASTLADGYLRSKFTLPIATPSADLKAAVCRVAAYDLLSVRGFNPETGSDPNIRDRYQDAIRWLEGVAKGSITPALIDSSPGGQLGGPFVLQARLSDASASADGRATVVAGAPSARGW